ncbi:MAG TPA: lysylphosphatidylglycerol synthase transmembrane domain-containing protein [Terriglobales bacterium]|nr:lysylphosphatidylglycerol synthase transmembrane domain-containing protein [Terriglobales bacterium]
MSKKRILTTVIVLAILGALVYFQIQHWRSFDWHRFRQASQVNLLHIAAAIVLVYCTYLLRALRWRIFLQPVKKTQTRRLLAPSFIGFTGLALLGRPGEFIRPYLIAKKEGVSVSSQIGVWTVERIFDVGAFTVLMTLDVFFSSQIRANPYVGKFRLAAVVLCILVAGMAFLAFLIQRRGHRFAEFLHRVSSRISPNLAHHVDQKVRAFGAGLNTIASKKALLQLVAVSLATWFLIALSYREVAHSYPPEPATPAEEVGAPSLDVENATLAGVPGMAGEELTPDVIDAVREGVRAKGYSVEEKSGEYWLVRRGKRIKKIGEHPHLSNLDVSRVLLLMGFSMIGSVVQLPAVGGGSQLAVISALQVIYGIPPELAVSCGILLWLVTFMSCIPVGLVLAHREHLSLRKLSEESAHEEEAEPIPSEPSGR